MKRISVIRCIARTERGWTAVTTWAVLWFHILPDCVLRNIEEVTGVSLGLFATIRPCVFTNYFQNKSKQSKRKGFWPIWHNLQSERSTDYFWIGRYKKELFPTGICGHMKKDENILLSLIFLFIVFMSQLYPSQNPPWSHDILYKCLTKFTSAEGFDENYVLLIFQILIHSISKMIP